MAFEGNETLTGDELLRTLPKPGSREFFDALDRRARLVTGARIAYAGRGHLRARVGPARTRFDAPSGRLKVTLPVREGASSVVAALTPPRRRASARGGRTGAEAARGRPVRRRGLPRRPGRARRVVPPGGLDGGAGARRPRGHGRRRPGDARRGFRAAAPPGRDPRRVGRADAREAWSDAPSRSGRARSSARGSSRRPGPGSRSSARSRRSTCGRFPPREKTASATWR